MVSPTTTSAVAATVAKFIGTISSRNYDQLPGFLAPDAVWWTAGNPSLPGDDGGAEPALDHVDLLRGGGNRYDEYSLTILSQVTEHSKSVIEGRVVGKGPLDLVYVNNVTMHLPSTPTTRSNSSTSTLIVSRSTGLSSGSRTTTS